MKNTLKKNLVKILSGAFLFSVCLSFGILNDGVHANAEETPNVKMVEGASIRFGEYSGIRFTAEVDKEYYDAISGEKQTGLYIIPYDLLGSNELNENVDKTLVKDVKTSVWKEDGKSFNSVIYNIPSSQYGRELAARAYVKTENGYEWSKETLVRSIAEVASKALNSEETYSDEELVDLKAYVDGCVDEILFDETSYVLAVSESVTMEYTIVSQNEKFDLSDLQVQFLSGDESIVKVDGNGRLTAVASGATTVKAVLGSKEISVDVTVATHVINTATDFDNFIKILVGYGNGKDNLQSAEMYVVLGADIDYKGGNLVTNTGRTKFDTNWCGTFDGRGHVISNITVDRGGLFGYIRGGTVKNLGLVEVTNDKSAADTGGLLCMMLTGGGAIDNCFVQGSFANASTTTGGGIAEFAYNGNSITNCITVVSGAKYAISGQESSSFVTPQHCYAISSDATYAYKTTATETVLFKTMSAFTTAHQTLSETGWASWWKIEDGQICFGSYKTEK